MTTTVEKFVEALLASGLITLAELDELLARRSADERPQSSQDLAKLLVAEKRLTRFQAIEVYQGRPRGLVLGNYVLLDRLGAGGMGLVFKAQHRAMKRLVALKTLPKKIANSPPSVKRFHREVEAAARLTHPNIVRAYDAGEERGIHFLVMEYFEGSDLAHYVRRCGKLSQHKAIDYMLQAARGLHYAHQMGVIHRDIKPGNLLLDAEGVIRVLDMGLARLEAVGQDLAGSDSHEDLTTSGRVIGTVDYMAPEQAIDSKHVDRRADIYGLGCTLYFLLTGRCPTPDGSLTEKLLWHQSGEIPSIGAVRGDVIPLLEQTFRRMMARKVDDRYPSMAELIDDLEACLEKAKADTEATIDLKPSQPVELKPDDFVVPEIIADEPPPSGETRREQVKREATLHDSGPRALDGDANLAGRVLLESTRTLVVGRGRAARQERQFQVVTAGVLLTGLIGGLVLWGGSAMEWPSATPGWNREARELVEEIYELGVESDAGRQTYSDLDTAIEMGIDGQWWIGNGLSRDKQAHYIRLESGELQSRSLSAVEAVDAGLTSATQVVRRIDRSFRTRSQIVLTLDRPRLTLATTADGKRRVAGRVFGTLSGNQRMADIKFVLRGTDRTGRMTHSSEEIQHSSDNTMSTGWLDIDIEIDNPNFELDGTLELYCMAFLFEPKAGIFRISNELPVTLAAAPTSAAETSDPPTFGGNAAPSESAAP